MTGFTNVESSLTGKWLELLKELAPSTKRVAFIFNPELAPGGGSYYMRLIEASCSIIRGGANCNTGSRCRRDRACHR